MIHEEPMEESVKMITEFINFSDNLVLILLNTANFE